MKGFYIYRPYEAAWGEVSEKHYLEMLLQFEHNPRAWEGWMAIWLE